jgi:hypothetical protein
MAIVEADIEYRFSVTTGPGDSTAGSASTSLGEFISTTEITDATLHNLFDAISGSENAAEDVEYRCIFAYNSHATLTWQNVTAWLESEVSGGANAAISVDTTAASAVDSASAQAKEVANESTAPSGQTFSSPTTKAAGLSMGNIGPGEVKALWIQRTATDSSALSSDGVTIRLEGDTEA